MNVALAGASVLAFRLLNGIGYAYGGAKHPLKKLGGLFHIPEIYTLYVGAPHGPAPRGGRRHFF